MENCKKVPFDLHQMFPLVPLSYKSKIKLEMLNLAEEKKSSLEDLDAAWGKITFI